jgi:hypothetical protein
MRVYAGPAKKRRRHAMGEKEPVTAADAGARSGTASVSGNPGGSSSAGILSAAVSSVGNLTDAGGAGDPSTAAASAERDKLKGGTKTQGDFNLSH